MKVFIACRIRGENKQYLRKLLNVVSTALDQTGVDRFSTFQNITEETLSGNRARDIMRIAFDEIEKSDLVLVIHHSSRKSEGMLMEVGYSIAKNKPFIIATKHGLSYSYLPNMSENNIFWNDLEDLHNNIVINNYIKRACLAASTNTKHH